ncbi:MAG: hypothetical protein ONB05_10225, partial [candidate division KSB1 bacterium]|nr:hypothetical protein [candidate division KSB1 bacterium]
MLKSYLVGVLLLVSYSLMVKADELDNSLKVIASSDRDLIIEFVPPGWRMDSLQIDGDWYQKLSCLGAGFSGQEGQPLIPVKVAMVGIPVAAQPRYTLLEASFQQLSPIKLLPHPRLVVEEGLAIEKYIPDTEFYQLGNVFPKEIVELEPPGYFRHQRIVRVKIYPVQYIPAEGIVRRYDKIVVK